MAWHRVVLSNQRQSMAVYVAIDDHQWSDLRQSAAISGNQRQSAAISGNQRQSAAINGQTCGALNHSKRCLSPHAAQNERQ